MPLAMIRLATSYQIDLNTASSVMIARCDARYEDSSGRVWKMTKPTNLVLTFLEAVCLA